MNRFILLSFLVMGWTYYELSGGAAFVPETRPQMMAEAEIETPSTSDELPVVEVVTRADTETLDALPEDISPTPEAIALAPDVAETVAPSVDAAVEAALQEPAPAVASSGLDLREVTGDRVNMRTGPGTDYGVVDRLGQGSVIIVLETGADGWVRVEVERSGLTGWMSDQFLAGIDG